jgi:hypothetical protein
MQQILKVTVWLPPLNLIKAATGGANNAAMRHILELILCQQPSESDSGGDRWRQ